MEKSLDKRAVVAAENYLVYRDFDVLEVDLDRSFIVAFHNDDLVFVKVSIRDSGKTGFAFGDGIEPSAAFREECEGFAARWLLEHRDVNWVTVRFDSISMIALEDKALLRHHFSCLS